MTLPGDGVQLPLQFPQAKRTWGLIFRYLAGDEVTPGKTRAPNVTCNVRGAGLASKVCHFRNNLHLLMHRTAPADGLLGHSKTGNNLCIGLCTVYPQHVGVPMLLPGRAIARVSFKAKGTHPC
jgi:hypothetical protein